MTLTPRQRKIYFEICLNTTVLGVRTEEDTEDENTFIELIFRKYGLMYQVLFYGDGQTYANKLSTTATRLEYLPIKLDKEE